MDLTIVNGAAGEIGLTAEVNDSNQLSTRSVGVSAIHEATLLGNAYAFHAETADLAAGDTAMLLANESNTLSLVVHGCYFAADLATQVDFGFAPYPTFAGTAVTGVNLNSASTKTAASLATCYVDETDNTLANFILTGYHHVATAGQATTAVPIFYDFKDMIILGEHDCFGMNVVGNIAARFECTLIAYYINK